MRRRRSMGTIVEEDRLRQLIALGPTLVAELDLDLLLNRVLETACSVTAARYAALGILDKDRRELERFITVGLSEEEERVIGAPPHGRGVPGVLIHDPRPLRLTEVSAHPHSSGFPAGHPPMRSFLGVPIIIRGTAWGNLYLTNKRVGEFTDADEHSITTLATWAAIAVDHARLLAEASERQGQLEDAVRRLEATQAVAVAAGAETDLTRVLDLVAERGREMAAFDRDEGSPGFDESDEHVLVAFATNAATAVGQRRRATHSGWSPEPREPGPTTLPGHAARATVCRVACSRARVPASIALANDTSDRQPSAAT
ncbi:MAG TPA: GAF domain-containing protein [Solirubrobacteraceae bacterium]|nr:GAF domain-containing protein [Solirubrobacteraceae bacterium]